ncbi:MULTISPECIES: DUF6710 family protein [Thermoanaerobacter]|uniref:Uncharacterized protein n=2 Tax=Thermoanaerobacter TaxID=1754 RepID=B0KAV0_THEP3|nr:MULTISPECIES: DUF6710 family protein [Thermoanaerobacter]ABY93721.1 hypothetical protein Teth39_0048 [Thermoanaerobacter pseudethanolicus ATCC 33223]ADV78683.1 hypothetical protein Thebr_0051 [Thermoanaerobacter brockii subsp. finnii Ako-1]HBW60394.1 hypothetical protein [Thermoanaerobacter sp.]
MDQAYEFKYALEFTHQVLKNEKTKEDKILILDFMLDVIREDLKYDFLTAIFYREEYFEKGVRIPLPFPYSYYDETGTKRSIYENVVGIKKVYLAEECILVFPWHRGRIRESIKNIGKNEFQYDEFNHKAFYFSPVNICFVYNGMHSTAAGIGFKKGYIKANNYDVTKLFPHVHTDGLYWYNSHNNQKLEELFDFRIGVIYEISKIKHYIEKDIT